MLPSSALSVLETQDRDSQLKCTCLHYQCFQWDSENYWGDGEQGVNNAQSNNELLAMEITHQFTTWELGDKGEKEGCYLLIKEL